MAFQIANKNDGMLYVQAGKLKTAQKNYHEYISFLLPQIK